MRLFERKVIILESKVSHQRGFSLPTLSLLLVPPEGKSNFKITLMSSILEVPTLKIIFDVFDFNSHKFGFKPPTHHVLRNFFFSSKKKKKKPLTMAIKKIIYVNF